MTTLLSICQCGEPVYEHFVVPSGVANTGVSLANQVCTTVGSVADEAIVQGSGYLELSYGYKWSHTWRNLGIVIVYMLFCLAVNLITTEYERDEFAPGGVMVFKRERALRYPYRHPQPWQHFDSRGKTATCSS